MWPWWRIFCKVSRGFGQILPSQCLSISYWRCVCIRYKHKCTYSSVSHLQQAFFSVYLEIVCFLCVPLCCSGCFVCEGHRLQSDVKVAPLPQLNTLFVSFSVRLCDYFGAALMLYFTYNHICFKWCFYFPLCTNNAPWCTPKLNTYCTTHWSIPFKEYLYVELFTIYAFTQWTVFIGWVIIVSIVHILCN